MPIGMKKGFLATSLRRYVTNGTDNYHETMTIYVNLRDKPGEEMLLRKVAHEMYHLLNDEVSKEETYEFLKSRV